ncbi:GNAT family N-acetyltransferase [Nocardioides campestrisoli]|uniref:GNAT family N-acetyltransferase n=1 Tax=Nocardioides campestrisoli TaxID=2736757 RepID=UPI001CD22353|nr:GNAT family N-acetyltransferase [Nocardioides campestrisoli]
MTSVAAFDPQDLRIRPMHADDLRLVERLSSSAFVDLEARLAPAGQEAPSGRSVQAAQIWIARTARFLDSDPGGCWVAEVGDAVVGFATSFRRETTWFLATYAVATPWQGRGVGKALLDAALQHSRGCVRGMLSASSDPRAARRYKLAGFDLHPQMTLSGTVDRTAVPELRNLRDGTPGDQEWMDSLDRGNRGAGRGRDHEFLRSVHRLRVIDHRTGRGYAYSNLDGVQLLAADNRRTAARLLWDALAAVPPGRSTRVAHVTGANQWALETGMEAGLSVRLDGFLGLRGLKPPAPYLHHGALL